MASDVPVNHDAVRSVICIHVAFRWGRLNYTVLLKMTKLFLDLDTSETTAITIMNLTSTRQLLYSAVKHSSSNQQAERTTSADQLFRAPS